MLDSNWNVSYRPVGVADDTVAAPQSCQVGRGEGCAPECTSINNIEMFCALLSNVILWCALCTGQFLMMSTFPIRLHAKCTIFMESAYSALLRAHLCTLMSFQCIYCALRCSSSSKYVIQCTSGHFVSTYVLVIRIICALPVHFAAPLIC